MITLPDLFSSYLKIQGVSSVSVRNYRCDLNHFLGWLILKLKGQNLPTFENDEIKLVGYYFNSKHVAEYKEYLLSNRLPGSTVNRRLSTLRSFANYCLKQGYLSLNPVLGLANVAAEAAQEKLPNEDLLSLFQQSLALETISSNTIKNYLSDIREFLTYIQVNSDSNRNFFNRINSHSLSSFKYFLAAKGASESSIKRVESSLRKFCAWGVKEKYLLKNPFEKKSLFSFPLAINHLPLTIKSYRALPYFTYLNFLILVIFLGALGFGLYQQFIVKAPQNLAFPNAPVAPKRYLSFQGRLTDTSGNPLENAINFQFQIYDAVGTGTPPTGGNLLWNSGTCSIDPDQDGIFNSILGSDCGSEITSSVFTENSQAWLQVTVDDETLSPRIQIATVAYALNAETLQGFPIASTTNADPNATMGATAKTIPAINPAGNLIIAAASPSLWSTSGTFQIKGQALSIVTATGTNGNVIMAPDGAGTVNLTFSSLATGSAINAQAAQLGTSAGKEFNNLIYGKVANSTNNYNLLKLESGSSPTAKFTIDYAGNASMAGAMTILSTDVNALDVAGGIYAGTADAFKIDTTGSITAMGSALSTSFGGTGQNWSAITVGNLPYFSGTGTMTTLTPGSSGYILQSNGAAAPSWVDSSSLSSASLWTLGNGSIYPKYSTVDLLLGATATSSALTKLPGTNAGSAWINFGGGIGNTFSASASGTTKLAVNSGGLNVYGYSTASGGLALGYSTMKAGPNIVVAGNVGIGTTDPSFRLEITGSGYGTASTNLYAGSGLAFDSQWSNYGRWGSGIYVNSATAYYGTGSTNGVSTLEQNDGILFFSTGTSNGSGNVASLSEKFRITKDGNVGIGTTNPGYKLDVVGNASFSGNLMAGGQLRAGQFATAPLTAGAGSLYYNAGDSSLYLSNGSTWSALAAGAVQYWQTNLGALSPAAITNSLLLGSNATSSALVNLPGINKGSAWINFGGGTLDTFSASSSGTTKFVVNIGGINTYGYATISSSLSVGSSNAPAGVGNAIFSGNITSPGTGGNSEKFGLGSRASGGGNLAFGYGANASGSDNAIAIGYNSAASGQQAFALGSSSNASGIRATVLGNSATSTGNDSTTIGNSATGNHNAVIVGQGSSGGEGSTVLGQGATATSNYSIAIGRGADTTASYQLVAGDTTYYISDIYFGKGVTDASPIAYTIHGTGGSGSNIGGANLQLAGGQGTGTGMGGSILFQTSPSGNSGSGANSLSTRMTIDGYGNVGIGTTAPVGNLHIVAGGGNGALVLNQTSTGNLISASNSGTLVYSVSPTGYATMSGGLAVGYSSMLAGPNMVVAGSVGIGTTNPQNKLDVIGNINFGNRQNGGNQPGYLSNIWSAGDGYRFATIGSTYFNGTNWITNPGTSFGSNNVSTIGMDTNGVRFYTQSSSGNTQRTDTSATFDSYEKMRIDINGNVGIGTTNPGYKLDVVGNASFSGNLMAGGQLRAGQFANAPLTAGAGSMYYNSGNSTLYLSDGSSWSAFSTGAVQYWQTNLGALSPAAITNSLLLGSTATSSALVNLPGLNKGSAWINFGGGTSDTFSASASGTTKLAVNNGGLNVYGYATSSGGLAVGYSSMLAGPNAVILGKVGIGTSNPLSALDVRGSASISGNLTLAGGARTITSTNMSSLTLGDSITGSVVFNPANYIRYGNQTTYSLTRTVPTTINDEVDLGTFNTIQGSASFDISIVVSNSNFMYSKRYLVDTSYNQTSGSWYTALPITDSASSTSNNFALDVMVSSAQVSFRLRRTYGSTAGTAYIVIKQEGYNSTFTASTSTSSVSAPTTYMPTTLFTQQAGRFILPTNLLLGDSIVGPGKIYNNLAGTTAGGIGVDEATTNLVTNPSFETDLIGYSCYGSRSTNAAYYGGYGNETVNPSQYGCVLKTNNIAVNGSTRYTWSFWIKGSSSSSSYHYYVTDVTNSTNLVDTYLTLTASQWTRHTVSFTTASNTANVTLNLQWDGAGSVTIDIDGEQLEQKPYATSYCDGSMGPAYYWSGTAHASTSFRSGGTFVTDNRALILGLGVDYVGTQSALRVNQGGSGTAFLLNQLGSGAIFTASSSGTTKLTLDNGGNLSLTGYATMSSSLAIGYSSILSGVGNAAFAGSVGIGTTNPSYKLDVQGGYANASAGLCINGDCKTAWSSITGTNYWTVADGTIYPNYATADFLIGGIATSSAKFAFINNLTGTPTATFSGNLVLASTAGTTRSISSTNMNPLFIGGTTTGTIQMAAGSATPAFVLTSAGQVGIGTTAPTNPLHVIGNIYTTTDVQATGTLTANGGSTFGIITTGAPFVAWNNVGLQLYDGSPGNQNVQIGGTGNSWINSGSVGLGTTNPGYKLEVVGNASFSGNLMAGGQLRAGQFAAAPLTAGAGSMYYNSGNSTLYLSDGSSWSAFSTGAVQYWQSNEGALSPVNITNSLLLGANATSSALVNLPGLNKGSAWINFGGGTSDTFSASASGTTKLAVNNGGLNVYGYSTASGSLAVGYSSVLAGTGNAAFAGNVGIGTTNPDYKLKVMGTIAAVSGADGSTITSILGATGNAAGWLDLRYDGAQKVHLSSGVASGDTFFMDSNVGIGTTGPGNKLEIYGTTAQMRFKDSVRGVNWDIGPQTAVNIFEFKNDAGSVLNYAFTNGNVGIGTTNPGYSLDVVGNSSFSGNLMAGGQLRAGQFAAAPLAAGAGSLYYNAGDSSLYLSNGSTWSALAAGAVQYWQTNLGALSPAAITNSLLLGANATSSALVNLPGLNKGSAWINFGGGIGDTFSASASGTTKLAVNMGGINTYGYATSSGGLAVGYSNMLAGPNLVIAGSIGIGTTTPQNKLEVASGGLRVMGDASSTSVGAGTEIRYIAGTGGVLQTYDRAGSAWLNTYIQGKDILLMAQSGGGNVGIGITAPVGALHVDKNAGGNAALIVNQTGFGDIFSASYSGTTKFNLSNQGYATLSANLTVGTPTVVPGPGNININGSLYAHRFVENYGGSTQYFLDPGGISSLNLAGYATAGASLAVGYTNAPLGVGNAAFSGKVGIGTTDPTYSLHVKTSDNTLRSNIRAENTTSRTIDLISFGSGFGTAELANQTAVQSYGGGHLYLIANDAAADVIFRAGGWDIEGMRLDHHSNVGIGTTNPLAKLDVTGTASVSSNLYLGNSIRPSNSPLTFDYKSGVNSWTAGMTLANTGNLGIGTTNPTSKLYVSGVSGNLFTVFDGLIEDINIASTAATINVPASFTAAGDTSMAYDLNFTNPTASYIKSAAPLYVQAGETFGSSDLTLRTFNYGDINLEASTGGRLTLKGSTGTLGVGYTSPVATLDIRGNAVGTWNKPSLMVSETSGGFVGLVAVDSSSGPALLWDSDLPLRLGTGGSTAADPDSAFTERLRFTASGDVGIGSSAPEAKLQVTGGGLCVGSDTNCNTDNDTEGTVYSISTAMTAYDVAENYPTKDNSLMAEEVVVLDSDNDVFVKRSSGASNETVLGVISANPAVHMGGFNGAQFKEERQVAIGLSGRIPVKISSEGGDIKVGDNLTASSIPGVAKKATSAGMVIGQALEDYNNPDPQNIDSIMFFINPGWYDPNLYLSDTGDILIVGQSDDLNVSASEYQSFSLSDSAGQIIQRVGAFSEAVAANLRAGLIQTQVLIAENLIVNQKMVSPIVETDELRIKNNELRITNKDGEILTETNNEGQTTHFGDLMVQGTVDSSQLAVSGDATIGGTLYADEIVTKHGTFGDLLARQITVSTVSAQYITNNIQQTTYNIIQSTPSASTSPSATPTPTPDLTAPISSESALLLSQADTWTLSDITQDLKITTNLQVIGHSSLADTTVAGNLMIDGEMNINAYGINSLTGPLYLNPLGFGGIDMLAGKVVIDVEGNVQIAGTLAAKEIKALPDSDLTLNLERQNTAGLAAPESGFGKLLVKGVGNETVASIDSEGNAAFKKITIAADYTATQSAYWAEVTTNATSGKGVLPAWNTEFTVFNPKVSNDTLIYVTPEGSTQNKVLYVSAKQAEDPVASVSGYFKIAVDSPIDTDINFNWWIIN